MIATATKRGAWFVRPAAILLFAAGLSVQLAQAQVGKGSADFAAENLMKTIAMENSISGKEKAVSIYIIGDEQVTAALSSDIGKKIGSATLQTVKGGLTLPATPPDVLYIGNPDEYMTDPPKLKALVDYARTNKVMTVTYEPILVYKGVALGIGAQEGGTAKFMLNLQASKEQGLDWNKAFIKLAETI